MTAQYHTVHPLRNGRPDVQALVTAPTRRFGKHSHDQFGIGLVMQGEHASHSWTGNVVAAPGDCITVHPDEVHDGVPLGDQPRVWFMLYMDPTIVAAAADTYEFSQPVLRDARRRAALCATYHTLAADEGNAMLVEQEVLYLLGLAAGRRPGKIAASPRLLRARQMIDDCPSAQLTLDELAGAADMDKFQLVRGFRHVFSLPPTRISCNAAYSLPACCWRVVCRSAALPSMPGSPIKAMLRACLPAHWVLRQLLIVAPSPDARNFVQDRFLLNSYAPRTEENDARDSRIYTAGVCHGNSR